MLLSPPETCRPSSVNLPPDTNVTQSSLVLSNPDGRISIRNLEITGFSKSCEFPSAWRHTKDCEQFYVLFKTPPRYSEESIEHKLRRRIIDSDKSRVASVRPPRVASWSPCTFLLSRPRANCGAHTRKFRVWVEKGGNLLHQSPSRQLH